MKISSFFVCAIALMLVGCSTIQPRETQCAKGRELVLPVVLRNGTTRSMYPAIKPGDSVLISFLPYEKLEVGMIVTRFSDSIGPNQFLTHRITKRFSNGTFETRGDFNAYPDSDFLTKQNYIGVASKTDLTPELAVMRIVKM